MARQLGRQRQISARVAGIFLSGALYHAVGMSACLLGSAVMLLACWLITFLLPLRSKDRLAGRDPSPADAL